MSDTAPLKTVPEAKELGQFSLADIAIRLPGSTAVLHRHRLDFCCGGKKTLADAAAEKNLDVAAIREELAALPLGAGSGQKAPTTAKELIDHIIVRYHEVHRQQFPELIRMAERVEKVHGERPDVPRGLAALLHSMQAEMEEHMQKEEQMLFPMMKSSDGTPVANGPIAAMRHEHDAQGLHVDKMAEITHNETPPEGACNTWRALYSGLAQLRHDMMEHIHLENNVLFPQFEPKEKRAAAQPVA
ncbi:MAG: iron-sulfur cluster repair protein YtfE [Brachymonas sp.]|nr:iron-sulfur cluster repair protein YtfE [Brachymonas sp.]